MSLWRYLLVLMLVSVPIGGGIAGLVAGFVIWSQFFWDDGPPVPFLSPTGFLLTLLTGLFSFVVSAIFAVVKGARILKRG